MDKLEYIPGDLVSVYVGVKKYIVEVIGTENENKALLYQIKFPNREIQYAVSKNQEDGVDAKLPDIDELIKKLASDEFIEKKIKDILGDNDVDSGKEK